MALQIPRSRSERFAAQKDLWHILFCNKRNKCLALKHLAILLQHSDDDEDRILPKTTFCSHSSFKTVRLDSIDNDGDAK